MRVAVIKAFISVAALTAALVGCSGRVDPSDAPSSRTPDPQSSETAVAPPVSDPTFAEPAPTVSDIVDNYETATCGDWLVTSKSNRQIVATYFIVRANDHRFDNQELTVETAITTACKALPAEITVKKVAETSIADLKRVLK